MDELRISSPMFDRQFDGRRVLVTGAGRGLGADISSAFAEAGASVMLADISPEVHEVAQGLSGRGYQARSAVVDITSEEDVSSMMVEVGRQLGGLDVLVNNAGIITISELTKLSLADFERVLAVNTTGIFLCCREAAPMLREQGGAILNAASGQARQGFIYTPHYAASKFGVVGLSQSLAKELASDGVRVNSYCPGIVETPMWEYNDRVWGELLGDYEPGELIREWIGNIPLGRPATGSDVANTLLFLASDAGNYITGQAINIDGGMFMS